MRTPAANSVAINKGANLKSRRLIEGLHDSLSRSEGLRYRDSSGLLAGQRMLVSSESQCSIIATSRAIGVRAWSRRSRRSTTAPCRFSRSFNRTG